MAIPFALNGYSVNRYPFSKGSYMNMPIFHDKSFNWAFINKQGFIILSENKPKEEIVKNFDKNALQEIAETVVLPQGKSHTYGKLENPNWLVEFWALSDYSEADSIRKIVWE